MDEAEEDLTITVQHRGKAIDVQAKPSWSVSTLKSYLEQHTSIQPAYQRLLYQKSLLSDSTHLKDLELGSGSKILLVGSSSNVVDSIKNAKPDPLVRGFTSRTSRGSFEVKRRKEFGSLSGYGFDGVQELKGYHDAWRARELLEKIASDSQVIAVMNNHKWRVGTLREMEPEGKVGIDPVCVLGLNINKGAEIHLRLRTDDKKGFRSYFKLKEVLWHELSHNVYSEHDANFYQLMRDIEKEGKESDWKLKAGFIVGGDRDVAMAPEAPDPLDEGSEGMITGGTARLGGSTGHGNLRISVAQAAERRRQERKTENERVVKREVQSECDGMKTSSSEPQGAQPSKKESIPEVADRNERDEIVLRMQEMGYSAVASRLALRFSRGDFARAVEWLVTYDSQSQRGGNTDDAFDSDKQATWSQNERSIKTSLEALRREISPAEYAEVLEVLYMYTDNLARHPNSLKFCTIKQSNNVFQSRIAKHNAAVDILKSTGWRLNEDKWVATNPNVEAIWGAKGLLMDEIMQTSRASLSR